MNDLPDSVLLKIFSYVSLHSQIKLERVSTRWNSVLNDKSLRKVRNLDLRLLVKDDISKLPDAVHSLLVNKHKIITSIACDTWTRLDMDTLNTVLSIFSSNRPDQLISIKTDNKLGLWEYQSEDLGKFLYCFVNLEVLDLSANNRGRGTKIDLSQLVKLKELKVTGVPFVNCRAHHLVKMDLRNVILHSPLNDCNDFVQMMLSVAGSIEVLHFNDVQVGYCFIPPGQQTVIKFPKLSDFNLSADCSFACIIVNLVECCNLKRFHVDNGNVVVTNFNLSIHCLEYLFIATRVNTHNITSQFLDSAKANPQRLCLLEYLEITFAKFFPLSQTLVEVLDCFNPFYTYSLREFISDKELTDSNIGGIIALIEHCPHLNRIRLGDCIDEEVLIDLIVATVPLDIHVNGLRIHVCSSQWFYENDFAIQLYDSLSLIDPITMKCQNKLFIKIHSPNNLMVGITKMMTDKFNIIFLSTEEQFELEVGK